MQNKQKFNQTKLISFLVFLVAVIGVLIFIFGSNLNWFKPSTSFKNSSNNPDKIKLDLEKIEIADTQTKREQGLMNRLDLCAKCGMLFVFETENKVSFWMKNTPLSLDMIFIQSDGKITNIVAAVEPNNSTKIYTSSSPVRYVLEVNAGFSEQNNLKNNQYLDLDWIKSKAT